MTTSWIYLDNNATSQPAPQVVAKMTEALEQWWANPSSVHRFGQMVRHQVELARAAVARLLNCTDRELVFTSGGTESNNLALRGMLHPPASRQGAPRRQVLITTPIEHSAIREPAQHLEQSGVELIYLSVDRTGWVDPAELEAALANQAHDQPLVLVSVQWANNETGVIQPVAELGQLVREYRSEHSLKVLLHIDGTQMVGKMPTDVKQVGADLLSMSAHKFHGPKGVGALYIRRGVRLVPQQSGGPQERERRGGTENVPGIVGMGVAAELSSDFVQDSGRVTALRALRDRFEQGILAALPQTVVNGTGNPKAYRLWNTSNLGFPRLEAEAILLTMSERGLCASAGAACSSGSLDPSPVLLAMGIPEDVAHGSVRFSLSRYTTDQEIDQALQIIPEVVRKLCRTMASV